MFIAITQRKNRASERAVAKRDYGRWQAQEAVVMTSVAVVHHTRPCIGQFVLAFATRELTGWRVELSTPDCRRRQHCRERKRGGCYLNRPRILRARSAVHPSMVRVTCCRNVPLWTGQSWSGAASPRLRYSV